MKLITDAELSDVLAAEKYREKREQYVERMVAEGFGIMTPSDNELLLDIDTEDDWKFFQKAVARLQEEYPRLVNWAAWPSKSGLPRRHALVTVPFVVDDVQRIAFQAVLGSDRVREMLSLFRCRCGDPVPTLLAEPLKTDYIW